MNLISVKGNIMQIPPDVRSVNVLLILVSSSLMFKLELAIKFKANPNKCRYQVFVLFCHSQCFLD